MDEGHKFIGLAVMCYPRKTKLIYLFILFITCNGLVNDWFPILQSSKDTGKKWAKLLDFGFVSKAPARVKLSKCPGRVLK